MAVWGFGGLLGACEVHSAEQGGVRPGRRAREGECNVHSPAYINRRAVAWADAIGTSQEL
jgi:hypothetical protein